MCTIETQVRQIAYPIYVEENKLDSSVFTYEDFVDLINEDPEKFDELMDRSMIICHEKFKGVSKLIMTDDFEIKFAEKLKDLLIYTEFDFIDESEKETVSIINHIFNSHNDDFLIRVEDHLGIEEANYDTKFKELYEKFRCGFMIDLESMLEFFSEFRYQSYGFPVVSLDFSSVLYREWSVTFRNPKNFKNPCIYDVDPQKACMKTITYLLLVKAFM